MAYFAYKGSKSLWAPLNLIQSYRKFRRVGATVQIQNTTVVLDRESPLGSMTVSQALAKFKTFYALEKASRAGASKASSRLWRKTTDAERKEYDKLVARLDTLLAKHKLDAKERKNKDEIRRLKAACSICRKLGIDFTVIESAVMWREQQARDIKAERRALSSKQ